MPTIIPVIIPIIEKREIRKIFEFVNPKIITIHKPCPNIWKNAPTVEIPTKEAFLKIIFATYIAKNEIIPPEKLNNVERVKRLLIMSEEIIILPDKTKKASVDLFSLMRIKTTRLATPSLIINGRVNIESITESKLDRAIRNEIILIFSTLFKELYFLMSFSNTI